MNFMRWAVLLCLGCLFVGCQSQSTSTTADGKEKPLFELSEPVPLPGNHNEISITVDPNQKPADGSKSNTESNDENRSDRNRDAGGNSSGKSGEKADDKPKTMFDPENMRVKPGHWIAVQSEGVSNQDDFAGQLKYSMRLGNLNPQLIPGTRYFQGSHRPATLAKEQEKRFETPLFVVDSPRLNVLAELTTRSGGLVINQPERFLTLKDHQYHCVVLSDRPDTYNFLSVLPSIRNLRLNQWLGETQDYSQEESGATVQDFSNSEMPFQIDSLYYKLTLSRWKSEVELPTNVQQWTSIAYLVWSDFAPDRLSVDQQIALVDWLHFGGQLIVSGDGLDALNNSFLKDYLPVRPVSSQNEPGTTLLPMLERWGLHKDSNGQLILPNFSSTDVFVRNVWELRPEAVEIPGTSGLVAEHQVGKGRIVTTAFPLNMTKLRSWTSLDHWFNSCLLRRPGRTHRSEEEVMNVVQPWQFPTPLNNGQGTAEPGPASITGFGWNSNGLDPHLPSVFTTLNFAARDWRLYQPMATNQNNNFPTEVGTNQIYLPAFNEEARRFAIGSGQRSQGQWDDYSEFSRAARACLKEQAGITPPSREWVLQALLIYLAVLVPLNYVVFRLARRLELAWFSIPLIAIVGAVMVVRAASLDIGFSNKMLQVNLIEVPTDYSRGHLTGYGSLYSSLTTQFRFESENATTVALPFPAANVPTELGETPAEFVFEYGRPVKFGPQQVLSNTMEMYQFQQIVDLGGPFKFTRASSDSGATDGVDRIENRSKLNVADVGLFKLADDRQTVMFCRLPNLAAGAVLTVPWQVLEQEEQLPNSWAGTCLEDRAFNLSKVIGLFAAAERDPYAMPWPEAVAFLADKEPSVAESLQAVATRRNLASDLKLESGLLDSALQEISPPGLSLGSMFRAATRYPLGPGEVRMVGWTDEVVEQWKVYPVASQSSQRSLVLAHLVQPDLPALGFDTNLAYPPRNSQRKDDSLLDGVELDASETDSESQDNGG
ncbi:MAG: hypothetical protein JNL67_19360 [Planctomycetaceae bacterium]|nr:hypothetical protein [Planctomycetaceae bacterium]